MEITEVRTREDMINNLKANGNLTKKITKKLVIQVKGIYRIIVDIML